MKKALLLAGLLGATYGKLWNRDEDVEGDDTDKKDVDVDEQEEEENDAYGHKDEKPINKKRSIQEIEEDLRSRFEEIIENREDYEIAAQSDDGNVIIRLMDVGETEVKAITEIRRVGSIHPD